MERIDVARILDPGISVHCTNTCSTMADMQQTNEMVSV